jgi:hypothetical protein
MENESSSSSDENERPSSPGILRPYNPDDKDGYIARLQQREKKKWNASTAGLRQSSKSKAKPRVVTKIKPKKSGVGERMVDEILNGKRQLPQAPRDDDVTEDDDVGEEEDVMAVYAASSSEDEA